MSTLFIICCTLILGILLFLYFYMKVFVFTYWKNHGIWQLLPIIPVGSAWPLIWERQHIGDFLRDIYKKIRSGNRKYGGFYILTKPMLMLTDPESIKQVLTKDFNHFKGRGLMCNEEVDCLSVSIFHLSGDKWKRIRSILSPFFTPNSIRNIFPIITGYEETLTELLNKYSDQNKCLEINDIINRFLCLVTSNCIFGCDCNALKDPNDIMLLVGKDIFHPGKLDAVRRNFFFLYPKVLEFFKILGNSKLVTDFFTNLAKDSIEYREKNNINRTDLMQLLVNVRSKDIFPNGKGIEDGLSFNEIASQCWVFFTAVFETTSTAVSFAVFELSRNQDIQNKLRKEVLEILQKHGGKFTYDSINEMKYTEKVFQESLRKYPPVVFLSRECTSDKYTFENLNITVRKGDSISISIYGFHSDPEYFPNPEIFDPERFNDDKYNNSHIYLPFGEGPKSCIGVRIGMMQGIYTLALLISKFKFYLNEKTKLPIQMDKTGFTFIVEGGIWLNVERV